MRPGFASHCVAHGHRRHPSVNSLLGMTFKIPRLEIPRLASTLTVMLLMVSGSSAFAAEWITIRGRLVPVNEDEGLVEKSFTLQALLEESSDRSELIWTLEEGGAGSWSWIDQFGQLTWDDRGNLGASSLVPSLRYEAGELRGAVPLTLVLPRPEEPLAIGVKWEHDGLRHEVVEAARVAEETAWMVSVRNNFGEKRTVLATMPAGLIVENQETVFLGQGDRFRLQYQVAERRSFPANDWEQAKSDVERLQQLRGELAWRAHEADRTWSDQQRELLKEKLPSVRSSTRTESLTTLLRAAEQQSRLERGRAGALEELRRRAMDSSLPDFQLEPLGAPPLAKNDILENVTIFHFWDYRDSPLREPYGQAGYLDFLSRKHAERGLQVVGIVVPTNPNAPDELRQSAAGARRFANFMNLAYPLYIDQNGLLARVGDPRICEANLPLFVVVGRDGKVVHYHAGHYEVENNRGLVELEQVIEAALRKGE